MPSGAVAELRGSAVGEGSTAAGILTGPYSDAEQSITIAFENNQIQVY